MLSVGDLERGQMPLTVSEKARLLIECLPLLFFLLAFLFTVTVLDDITGAPSPVGLALFLGVVILAAGYQALQRRRDLASGVALVQEDLLQHAWRSGGASRSPFRGRFARLGTLRLTTTAYRQSAAEQRFRVRYSPASRIVWSLAPLRSPVGG